MEDRRLVLTDLNRRFYRRHGAAFGMTRQTPWRCWESVSQWVAAAATGRRLRVLDVGCGNGRYLGWLSTRFPDLSIEGTGVDISIPLLAQARRRRDTHSAGNRWIAVDLGAWPLASSRSFDLAVAWGVLHHFATEAERDRVLALLEESLRRGGVALLSSWVFDDRRLPPRVDAAEARRRTGVELSNGALESADALFGFADLPDAVRYCRLLTLGDLEGLVERSGLHLVASGEHANEPNRWIVAKSL